MKNILLLEDEALIQEMIKEILTHNGYNVITANNGQEAIDLFKENDISLAILDIMVPKLDGFSVCRAIRKQSNVYIVILSARDSEDDKLLGYELGADSYVTKPFSPKVLAARINNLFSRANDEIITDSIIEKGNIRLDQKSCSVIIGGTHVHLRKKEYDLLLLLMNNEDIVLTRQEILDKVWGYDYYGDIRAVDSVIKSLRKHLSIDYINTVIGMGYKFVVKDH